MDHCEGEEQLRIGKEILIQLSSNGPQVVIMVTDWISINLCEEGNKALRLLCSNGTPSRWPIIRLLLLCLSVIRKYRGTNEEFAELLGDLLTILCHWDC